MAMPAVIGMTRTTRRADRILEAITAEIDRRRTALNNDEDVRSVTITVKMKNGTGMPRTAIMIVETEKTYGDGG